MNMPMATENTARAPKRSAVQPLAGIHHGTGQIEDFVPIQAGFGYGHDKGRDLGFGIAVAGNVGNDLSELGLVEPGARQLLAHVFHGVGRLGVVHQYLGLLRQIQVLEGLFRQAKFMQRYDAVVVHYVEHGQDFAAVLLDFDLAQGLEAFRLVQRAIPVQIGDVFMVGIDGNPFQAEGGVVIHDGR